MFQMVVKGFQRTVFLRFLVSFEYHGTPGRCHHQKDLTLNSLTPLTEDTKYWNDFTATPEENGAATSNFTKFKNDF